MDILQVLNNLRLLVVDDDADTLELIRFIFEQYNAQVSSTVSTTEAFRVIRLWKPDILISDIAMPIEDGCSFIRKVRSLKQEEGQIPAIALTALAAQEKLALNAGFSTYMVKPFNPDDLVKLVANLVLQKSFTLSPTAYD
ncbi:MAG: response regulator [Chlorogloeopsis fritschii C42_A2020_084]|jgi:CheY-like chemotaxis protein|uniref:response regulator n=1 Tax=Chlorogloeopsis fritschii TaxID=1124 RepID=UPI0019E74E41|nr:response regulator [Chlorogloeopsis fritschii]MBF2006826.1 response regulator [Chlorogloeopsis fritschii C42_A2020_084]